MSTMQASYRTPLRRWLIPAALLAVYLIWGSTYLAIRYMVEEFPALYGNAIRMLTAGGLLYAWLRRGGVRSPGARQWRNAALIGTLLFVGGLGMVSIAEEIGVGSGLAATAVALTPVWASLVAGLFGRWPNRTEWIGLAVGVAGVVLLSREGDFQAVPAGLALVVVAPILWAIASVWSNHLELPAGSMATALFMLTGGVALFLAGAVRGEAFDGMPGASGWLALIYLIGPGSLVAFSAYAFLLREVRPALATSYAYVNPVVAVVLGVWVGGETITGWGWPALALIVGSVGLIARQRGP